MNEKALKAMLARGGSSLADPSQLERIDSPMDVLRRAARGHGKRSTWSEALTLKALEALGLPAPEVEYRFHETKAWRFDFAWPAERVALEVEGGIYSGGAHGSISGILRDIEKYNAAAARGWRVIRALPAWMPGTSLDARIAKNLESLLLTPGADGAEV